MMQLVFVAVLVLAQGANLPAPSVKVSGRVVLELSPNASSAAKGNFPTALQITSVGQGRPLTARVAADGAFEFPTVRTGAYELSAVGLPLPPVVVNVAGQDIANLQVKIPLVPMVGRVLDPEGRPVPNARVSVIRDREFS